jgi:RHS repeat-associated protein
LLTEDQGEVVWPELRGEPNKLAPFGKDVAYSDGDIVRESYLLNFTNKEIDYNLDLHYFGARYYTADFPRFISPDPVSGRLMTPLTWNRYLYCRNDPINRIDPDGRSSLLFNFNTSSLDLFDCYGTLVTSFPAGNNTTANSNGPWPSGTFEFAYYVPHLESEADGPFGSFGNFVFNVPNRSGMGVHSGRRGPHSLTLGCIRTTNEGTEYILNFHQEDPLTHIAVIGDYQSDIIIQGVVYMFLFQPLIVVNNFFEEQ